jgi:hypothetical protein
VFYAQNCTLPQVQPLKAALLVQVRQKIDEMQKKDPALKDLDQAVAAKLREYQSIISDPQTKAILTDEIKKYYQALGLNNFTAKL